jgi:hypothetical protein
VKQPVMPLSLQAMHRHGLAHVALSEPEQCVLCCLQAGFGVTPALLSRNISLEVVKTMDSLYGNSTLQVRPM